MKLSIGMMLAALIAGFGTAASAQTTRGGRTTSSASAAPAPGAHNIVVSGEGELAIPVGNYSDITGIGIGGMLDGEYIVNPQVSATGRVGLQLHFNHSVGGADFHVHSIPILVGGKYYFQSTNRQGLFGLAEAGLFYLMSSASSGPYSASSSDLKLGIGAGVGYRMDALNFKVALHSHDIGHFGDAIMLTGGVAYEFAGL